LLNVIQFLFCCRFAPRHISRTYQR
jgi:hypothetical protein